MLKIDSIISITVVYDVINPFNSQSLTYILLVDFGEFLCKGIKVYQNIPIIIPADNGRDPLVLTDDNNDLEASRIIEYLSRPSM
jgi:hypothetical protein